MRKLILAIENLTVAPRLAQQYDAAKLKLKQGYWEDALNEFSAIESVLPGYESVPEIVQPLRQLSRQLADTGPESHRWQRIALRHPILLIVAVSLMPHMLAAVFNYLFNWQVLVHPMQLRGVEQAEPIFQMFAISVNSVLFLLGIIILVFLVRPIAKGLKGLACGVAVSSGKLYELRRRCLHLGQFIALIGLTMWIVAGPIYPILIGALEVRDYVYFATSLAISGLAVATFPFLIVTWLCTHVFYRPFVLPGSVSAGDIALLEQVEGWKWTYLLLAGALPMLVISLGFIVAPQSVNLLLGIVGLTGLAGFLLALMLFKAIQDDLVLLRQVLWACGSKSNLQ
jgi:eukaryotic-like serine/threonine-protein kinase